MSKPQSTRLRKIFRKKKLCWLWQPDFFTSFLVFWVKLCWTFGGKNSAGLWKLHSKQPENCFEQKRFFLRKLKISNFFGNFSEIGRKIFRSLGEVFRRRLSKLHFTGQSKLFEGFYFEVKRNFDLSTDIGRNIFGMCAKFFGMAVKIAS